MTESFGEVLTQLCELAGITRGQLARDAHLDSGYLTHLVKGARHPSRETIVVIARRFRHLPPGLELRLYRSAGYVAPPTAEVEPVLDELLEVLSDWRFTAHDLLVLRYDVLNVCRLTRERLDRRSVDAESIPSLAALERERIPLGIA